MNENHSDAEGFDGMAPDANRTNRIEDNPDSYYAGSGIGLIIAERRRQVSAEGYDSTHDDAHNTGEMAMAASAYACPRSERKMCSIRGNIPHVWPWDDDQWKPGPTRIRELVKAGALIAAEIDRILRKERIAQKKRGASR